MRITVLMLGLTCLIWSVSAQEKDEKKWSNSTEFSFVATDGNAKSETFGFGKQLIGIVEVFLKR